MQKYSASVVGLGFVGLATAVCFAKLGMRVLGIDIDRKKVSMISKGSAPFHEPRLEALLRESIRNGRVEVSNNVSLVANSPIIFITVGTPSKEDGSMEDRFLVSAARQIGSSTKRSKSYPLLVVKSTVIPGTLLNLIIPEVEKASGLKYGRGFGACCNPEFLREGSAVEDTLNPDRIVIGGNDKDTKTLREFYGGVYGKKLPGVIVTNLYNAELIKYANNAFLAMKISFINQIARICEELPGGDVSTVAEGIGLDKRISPLFLKAGLGFGGSCFPKDVKAFIQFSKRGGYRPPLAEATMRINFDQPLRAVEMAEEKLGDLKGKKVAVLGLAFKPDTDDMREAVSIRIIEELLRRGAKVSAHDPEAIDVAARIFENKINLERNVRKCLDGADCAILVTEWEDYARLRPQDFRGLMKRAFVIDGRRLFNKEKFSNSLEFAAIGLGNIRV